MSVAPFRGILYNPAHIRLGGVLAPPYDVISDERRGELYARDLRNIVRIDYGMPLPGDIRGENDVYTRARGHLDSWLSLGILLRSTQPGYVVTAHEFTMPDGTPRRRLGLFATVPARPWETSDLRPHERTLRGPKEDRLALMRATRAQTSAVFALWENAPAMDALFRRATAGASVLGGRTDGEFGDEKQIVWQVTGGELVNDITEALRDARLYVADGHHRYETAAAYAAEQRAANPGAPEDAPFERCLVYLCAGDDDGLAVLPTHRLIRPREGMPPSAEALASMLPAGVDVVPVNSLEEAAHAAALRRATHHAFGVALARGAALVARRHADPQPASPRERLDVVALEEILLRPLGIDENAVREGALAYSRNPAEVAAAVANGSAAMGITVNAATVEQTMGVAGAGEVMPQKSTYFYPKVPTGVVIAPL